MDEAVRDQEVERAIDRRRLGRAAGAAELVQQIVGLDRRVALPDQLEHPAAQRGEPRAAPRAQGRRLAQRIVDAARMVVIAGGGSGGGMAALPAAATVLPYSIAEGMRVARPRCLRLRGRGGAPVAAGQRRPSQRGQHGGG